MSEKEKIEILEKLTKEDLIKIILDITGGIPVNPYYLPPSEPYPKWNTDLENWRQVVYCNNNNTNLT